MHVSVSQSLDDLSSGSVDEFVQLHAFISDTGTSYLR